MSTIPKLRSTRHRYDAALRAVGREVRRLRVEKGMTQTDLAGPFTRAYVCGVERGHTVPSLSSLLYFSSRLGVAPAELLMAVNPYWQGEYTAGCEDDNARPPSPRRGGRNPEQARRTPDSQGTARGRPDAIAAGG